MYVYDIFDVHTSHIMSEPLALSLCISQAFVVVVVAVAAFRLRATAVCLWFGRSFVRSHTHSPYLFLKFFVSCVIFNACSFSSSPFLCACAVVRVSRTLPILYFGNSDANIPDSLFSVTMITLCVCVCVCVPIAFSITSSFARFTFSCAFNIRI